MTRTDNVDPMTQAIQRAAHLKEETCIGYSKTLTLFDRSSKEQRTSTKLNLAFPRQCYTLSSRSTQKLAPKQPYLQLSLLKDAKSDSNNASCDI